MSPDPVLLDVGDAPDYPGPLHSEAGEEPDLSHCSNSGHHSEHLVIQRSISSLWLDISYVTTKQDTT